MSKLELFKSIMKDFKTTQKAIKKLEKGKTLENPIDIDMVKTLKAGFFEKTLANYNKYKKAREVD